jgi:hypothetical protein
VRRAALVVVVALACGCSRAPEQANVTVSLSAPGSSANTGASIAASGSQVVVVWAAVVGEATNIFAAVSADGGAKFHPAVRVNDVDGDAKVSGEQAPRVAIGKDIAVAWVSKRDGISRIRLARSSDGGKTFAAAASPHDATLPGIRGWPSIAIDQDNVVHATWLDGRVAAHAKSMASMDHGDHAQHGSMRQDIYQAAWRPDGLSTESSVATDVCFCCKTATAIAPDGATYAAWRHIYPVNVRDMAVARLDDHGKTFSAPTRVSEDHWQLNGCPEDGPSIGVTSDGNLHIVWPTLLEGSDSHKAVFFSSSLDRGQTFAPRMRLDSSSGFAAHPQMATSGKFIAVVWEESGTLGHRIVMQELSNTVPSPQIGPGSVVTDSGKPSYPAVAMTTDTWLVAWTETTAKGSEIRVKRVR